MLIGLMGAPGAGRGAVAHELARCGWRTASFGEAVVIEAATAFAVDQLMLTSRKHHHASTPQLAVGNVNSRDFLEWAAIRGHNLMPPRSPAWVLEHWAMFRRASDAHWWVRPVHYWVQLERQQAERRGAEAMLVITDCAPGITAHAVRALGGHLVRVHRPSLAGAEQPADSLATVTGGAAADEDVLNDGSLDELRAEVARVVRSLQARERLCGARQADGTARSVA